LFNREILRYRAVSPGKTLVQLIAVYRTCSQLLEIGPILLRIFGRRKLDTVLLAQFLFAESEHRAKRRIHEQRSPL
jgi:hypothetical protein